MNNLIHAVPAIQASTIRIKPQSAEAITLVVEAYPGGPIRAVPKALYDSLQAKIQTQIPGLIRGVKYTAEELCTSAFWKAIKKADHNVAGKCIAIMIAHRLVQLRPAGKNASNACLYEVP
jgi:hypothetical protein